MFTFVAQVETLHEEPTFRCYNVNDSTGRIAVKCFNDGGPLSGVDVRVGEHVRVIGSLRCWGSDLHVSSHNVARLESPDELSFHFVEVVVKKGASCAYASPSGRKSCARPDTKRHQHGAAVLQMWTDNSLG